MKSRFGAAARHPASRSWGCASTDPGSPVGNGEAFERRYWLDHCEGYLVEGPQGRLGFVEELRDGGADGALIAVRAGRLGRTLLLVPTSDVAFVVPRAERLWLRSGFRLLARG